MLMGVALKISLGWLFLAMDIFNAVQCIRLEIGWVWLVKNADLAE